VNRSRGRLRRVVRDVLPTEQVPSGFDRDARTFRRYNDDQGATTTGFLRIGRGRFVDISFPGSQVTGPLKINDRRQIAGIYVDAGGGVHGFVWDDGEFTTIDVSGAAATAVLGINNHGQMVGSYIDGQGAYHGFLRDRNGAVTTLPEAPGADPAMGGTQPAAVNERGQIVGLADDAQGGSRAFLLERGCFKLIESPDAVYTRALDVNNRGRIVGDYGTKPPVGARGSTARSLHALRGFRAGVRGGWPWLT
jgi:uncharacterized membrane protein